jgi:hypothetical protein
MEYIKRYADQNISHIRICFCPFRAINCFTTCTQGDALRYCYCTLGASQQSVLTLLNNKPSQDMKNLFEDMSTKNITLLILKPKGLLATAQGIAL